MNREEILRMAREAGAHEHHVSEADDMPWSVEFSLTNLEAFAALARADVVTSAKNLEQQAEPVVEAVAWHFQLFEDWWDSHGFHNAFEAGQIDGKPLAKLAWEVAREIAPQQKQPEPEVTWRVHWDEDETCVSIIRYLPDGFEVVAYECNPVKPKQAEPVPWERDGSAGWAIEVEREACAQLCADYTEWGREWGQDSNHTAAEAAANECADAIRARGRQTPAQQAEPVVDRERLIGWLYPEGLEALRAGKPWTIYGTKQDHSNTPVYGAVAQKVEPHESESVEGSIPSLRHHLVHGWKTEAEPVIDDASGNPSF